MASFISWLVANLKQRKMKRVMNYRPGSKYDVRYLLNFECTNYKNLRMGVDCTFGGKVVFHCHGKITIGSRCMFAYGSSILTAGHNPDISDMQSTVEIKDVEVGDGVWVGAGAMILPGVRIGEGAVIGAGAVVTKDVDPFMIVAGVPAKVLRRRTLSDHQTN